MSIAPPRAYEGELSQLLELAEERATTPLRKRALSEHRRQGVPTTKVEEYKYTPLRDLLKTDWRPAERSDSTPTDLFLTGGVRIAIVNGRIVEELSSFNGARGLIIGTAGDEETLVELERFTFAALNAALFEEGVDLRIAQDFDGGWIEVAHYTNGEDVAAFPRLIVRAESGCDARLLESYRSNGRSLCVPVTEVEVEDGARLEHVRVQRESLDALHVGHWEVRQGADSEYRSCNLAFGGSTARLDQNIALLGEHAITRLDGVAVARGEQLIDNHTRLDHAVSNCNSFEIYKQVVDDQATIVFNGQILVRQDAQKTDAKQTNQALLLSPRATINSKPQLEIFADDVKCTHGATVGQIEKTMRFYLRSRGLPDEEAEAMLVYAFAAEVVELISDDELKHRLEQILLEKLREVT